MDDELYCPECGEDVGECECEKICIECEAIIGEDEGFVMTDEGPMCLECDGSEDDDDDDDE